MPGKPASAYKLSLSLALTFIAVILGPIILVGIPIKLAFTPWFVEFEYTVRNLPPDPYGLDSETRLKLALLGLESVLSDEGMEKFKKARLPNGRRAFTEREIRHMEDVKRVLEIFNTIFYLAISVWLAGLIIKRNLKWIGKVLALSSFLTLLIGLGSLGISLYDYDLAFEVFHNYVFDPYSWRFRYSDTLLRVYPMQFWFDGTVFVVGLSLLMSLLSLVVGIYLLIYRK